MQCNHSLTHAAFPTLAGARWGVGPKKPLMGAGVFQSASNWWSPSETGAAGSGAHDAPGGFVEIGRTPITKSPTQAPVKKN